MGGGGFHDFDEEPDDLNPSAATIAELKEAKRKAEEAQRKEAEARKKAETAGKRAEEAGRRAQEAETIQRQAIEREEDAIRKRNEARESARLAKEGELGAVRREEEARNAAQRVQKEAEERRERAEGEMSKAIDEAKQLVDEKQKAEDERRRMEKILDHLSAGIEPEFRPTEEQRALARAAISYQNDKLHFAVAGAVNSGKSSLINAFRGLLDTDDGAAPTGASETTFKTGRYLDPDPQLPRSRFVWYDIPGGGTQTTKGWQYFKNQGLFVFDVIILVTDTIVEADGILLQHCARLNVPAFIVRSKADQHIYNKQKAMRRGGLDDSYANARAKFISDTRQNIQKGLAEARLPPGSVYIVSNEGVHLVSTYMEGDRYPKDSASLSIYRELIDEKQLMRDILTTAYGRRYIGRHSMETAGE
jgi:GTP-binding protein EngB required for normal cell division